jgi:hypothetical protein
VGEASWARLEQEGHFKVRKLSLWLKNESKHGLDPVFTIELPLSMSITINHIHKMACIATLHKTSVGQETSWMLQI